MSSAGTFRLVRISVNNVSMYPDTSQGDDATPAFSPSSSSRLIKDDDEAAADALFHGGSADPSSRNDPQTTSTGLGSALK
jgi:hypothetical protein